MNNNYSPFYASFFERLAAIAIDWLIISLFFSILKIILALFIPFSLLLLVIPITLLFFTLFYNTFFIYKTGSTPGKKFIGIKVVKKDGNITLVEAFLRECIYKPISFILLGVGFIYMFFNNKRQTYYDKILNLIVIKYSLSSSSWLKKIFIAIVVILYFAYIIQLIQIPVVFNRFHYEDKKSLTIESIQEKIKIIDVSRDFIKKYGNEEEINKVKIKLEELCSKRFFGFFRNKNCQINDLDLKSLQELDKLCEQVVNYIIEIQNKQIVK